MVVRQRPIESITNEGASPSSTTRFTAVVLKCSSVLWSSNRPSIFIGLNISNTYASVDYPSDAAVTIESKAIAQDQYSPEVSITSQGQMGTQQGAYLSPDVNGPFHRM